MNSSEQQENYHYAGESIIIDSAEATPESSTAPSTPAIEKSLAYSPEQQSSFLQLYLCAAIIFNLLLLFFNGHSSDMGFWQNWVQQLSQNGYDGFNGNYPPIFIHWLYIVGGIYNFLGLPPEVNLHLKFLTQIPVIFSHMILIGIMFQLVKRYAVDKLQFHAVLLLTALNPALLLIGPIWGQVDILPLVPLTCALFISTSNRWRVLSLPLFTLALLTKFQMIAFAPVFGIIFFRHIKLHLLGTLLSLVTIAVVFLPYIVAGHFVPAFKFAYINVIEQYGLSTMGAANIWILLTGNATPDHLVLFGANPDSIAGAIFKAKNFGILLFFLVCLLVFLTGIYKHIKRKNTHSVQSQLSEILFYAITCSAAFFTLLPAMHERYLLPAVVAALAYYAVTPGRIFYALGLTFVCAFNVTMAHEIKTTYIWPAISYVILLILGYNIVELATNNKSRIIIKDLVNRVIRIPYLSAWLLILLLPGTFLYFYQRNVIHQPIITEKRILLTERRPDYARQDFGSLQINKNVSGSPISMAGKRYGTGLGTHANSHIDYTLPENAVGLSFVAGLDDKIESANVVFTVLGDGRRLWESPVIYGSERKLSETHIDVRGVRKISFKVSAMGSNHGDHANWANIVVELE